MTTSITLSDVQDQGIRICLTGTCLLLCELIWRVFKVLHEYLYYKNHYPLKNRIKAIVRSTFYMNSMAIIVYILTFTTTAILYFTVKGWYDYFQNQLMLLLPLYLLANMSKISHNLLSLAEWIRSDTRLDYGSGMASSYYHAHLKVILPDTGGEIKDIKERIEDYESKNNVYFPIKKLFVLIPNSLHTNPKIEGVNLEQAGELDPIKLGRGGVKRPYATAVYKIKSEAKAEAEQEAEAEIWYLCVEGATPLLSYHEAFNDNITRSEEMEIMQREILIRFYKMLKMILNNSPKTRGLCELIFYDDITPDGLLVDAGEVLKLRIQKLIMEGKADRRDY